MIPTITAFKWVPVFARGFVRDIHTRLKDLSDALSEKTTLDGGTFTFGDLTMVSMLGGLRDYLQHGLTISQRTPSIRSRSSFHGIWVGRLREFFRQHLHFLERSNHVSQRHSSPTSHLLPASTLPRRKTPIDAVGL